MARLEAKVIWKSTFWSALYSELGKRGEGENESGAFLLGREDSKEVIEFICYDDLEPGCLDKGYIHLTSKGFIKLWDHCYKKKLVVRADVHTHPGRVTKQSRTDRENPMIKIKGHIGIIVPCFAIPTVCDLNSLGVHEFLGNGFKWKSWKFKDGIIQEIR